jgi:hypothetical protein
VLSASHTPAEDEPVQRPWRLSDGRAEPGASRSPSADTNLNVPNNSYDRMYICARSVEVGT